MLLFLLLIHFIGWDSSIHVPCAFVDSIPISSITYGYSLGGGIEGNGEALPLRTELYLIFAFACFAIAFGRVGDGTWISILRIRRG
jgi:hypothetical protein